MFFSYNDVPLRIVKYFVIRDKIIHFNNLLFCIKPAVTSVQGIHVTIHVGLNVALLEIHFKNVFTLI